MKQAQSELVSKSNSSRMKSIDLLRGMAVLGVIAVHVPDDPGGWREHPCLPLAIIARFGYVGVPLFILISGFCIHRRAALTKQRTGVLNVSWREFWARRFFRLYPPFVVTIALSALLVYWPEGKHGNTQPFLWDCGLHLALVHNLVFVSEKGIGNGPLGTLSMEEQLYGLYALVAVLLTVGGHRRVLIVAGVTTCIWRLTWPWMDSIPIQGFPFNLGSWDVWPMQYWLHWALGALAVDAHVGNIRLPRWCYSRSIAFCFMLFAVALNRHVFELIRGSSKLMAIIGNFPSPSSPLLRMIQGVGELGFAVAFFIMLNWLVSQEANRQLNYWWCRILERIGMISYSIYLTHAVVLDVLAKFVPFGTGTTSWIVRQLTYSATCVAVGYVFFLLVEQWFLKPWQYNPLVAVRSWFVTPAKRLTSTEV